MVQILNATNNLLCRGENKEKIKGEGMDNSNSSCSWEFSPENRKFDFCNVDRMQNYVEERLFGK